MCCFFLLFLYIFLMICFRKFLLSWFGMKFIWFCDLHEKNVYSYRFFYTCSSNDQFQFHLHILSFALVNRGTHWQIILYIIKFKATDLFFVILLHCVGDMQFLFFNGKLIKIGDLLRNLFACAIFIQFLIECIRCQSVMHQKWNDAWPEKKITLTPRLN